MRIQIASDLHLEGIAPGTCPSGSAFRTVPRPRRAGAGRRHRQRDAWPAHLMPPRTCESSPVIYVPGNHEYYGFQPREDVDSRWRALADAHRGLHYLVAEGVTVCGVRFWGAPWYSNLWGLVDHWRAWDTWKLDMFERYILDFRYPHNSVNRVEPREAP